MNAQKAHPICLYVLVVLAIMVPATIPFIAIFLGFFVLRWSRRRRQRREAARVQSAPPPRDWNADASWW